MIKTWAVTDTGLVRKENQDTYRIVRNGDICVVCDGMGGAAGGRLASTLASETYAAEMEKALKPDMTPEQLREDSAYAVAMANRAVAERAEAEAALANMGTTLVAAVAYENGVVITNVGDSRAYKITRRRIVQITREGPLRALKAGNALRERDHGGGDHPHHQGSLSGGDHGGPR